MQLLAFDDSLNSVSFSLKGRIAVLYKDKNKHWLPNLNFQDQGVWSYP